MHRVTNSLLSARFSATAARAAPVARFACFATSASSSSSLMTSASAAAMSTATPIAAMARRYASSARETLRAQTLSEIQGEETQAAEPEPQVPAGWAVAHDLGTNFFTGKKSFGDESLELYCPLRSPKATAAERDAGREDGGAAQPFSVYIARTGKQTSMFVSRSVVAGELVVEQIRMVDGALAASQARDMHRGVGDKIGTAYEGPGIFELEEPFADPLFAFLEERGLSDEFGEFIALYAYHTEQREYVNWLQKLASFTQ